MKQKKFKFLYGPVPSWRLGRSLGIDPISAKEKICSFDCLYCQLGKTRILTDERKVFISVPQLMEELNALPELEIDYLTFSGIGEPTLAKNLGEMIRAVKLARKDKIAVITNASLLHRKEVQEELMPADMVVAKFDAHDQKVLETVNQPVPGLKMGTIIESLRNFRKIYKGKLALQIMFIEENKSYASQIAEIARSINPDEIQINTPLRPCGAKPLPKPELDLIEEFFKGMPLVSVYKAEKKPVQSISDKETLKRRGKI